MSAHDEGRAEAAAAVLAHWKNVAQKAREAGDYAAKKVSDVISRLRQLSPVH